MSSIDMAEMSQVVSDTSDPFDDVVEEGDFTDDVEMEASDEVEVDQDVVEDDGVDEGSSEDQPIEDESEDNGDESEEEQPEEESEESEPEESEEPELTLESLQEQLEKGEYSLDINGEQVNLKDLKNDYIGQKEISRRFTEYDKKIKSHEADVNEINQYVNTFAEKMKNGDSVGAMAYFGEFAGIPPYMVKEQLIAALSPEIMRRQEMTQMEIQNEYLQNENDYNKQRIESDLERQKFQQAQGELESQVNQIREAHNIEQQEWDDVFKHLDENLDEGVEITPELVQEAVLWQRGADRAENLINSYEGNLDEGQREEWIDKLADVQIANPDFTEEDLRDVFNMAQETLNKNKTEQKLAKKVEAKQKSQPKKQSKAQTLVEDEIDPELEDWF
jgi:hypothetical protein